MKRRAILPILGLLLLPGCVSVSDGRDSRVWNVTKSVDPITNVSHCVVSAVDSAVGVDFTRTGYLYPFVENNSQLGVVVGVSSGGRVRLPVGDILWRVDEKPFRTLRSMDSPTTVNASPSVAASPDAAMRDTIALAQRLAQTAGASSTAASGLRAQEMLGEMLSGTSLVFRTGTPSPTIGLPNPRTNDVGQFRDGKLVPIALDASFRDNLAACGIANPTVY